MSVESFIASCVNLPIGDYLPVSLEFVPSEQGGKASEMSDWSYIEEIQMTIRDVNHMEKRYGLNNNYALVLLCNKDNVWVVYRVKLC